MYLQDDPPIAQCTVTIVAYDLDGNQICALATSESGNVTLPFIYNRSADIIGPVMSCELINTTLLCYTYHPKQESGAGSGSSDDEKIGITTNKSLALQGRDVTLFGIMIFFAFILACYGLLIVLMFIILCGHHRHDFCEFLEHIICQTQDYEEM
jgi:hypothetical protein